MSNNLNISTTITTTTAGVGGGGEEEEIIVEPRVVRKPMHLKRIQIDTNSQKNESLSTVTPEAYNNNNNNNSAANQDTSSVSGASNVNNNKQLTYTITRTYIAPNGKTKTKTIEYFGDEAKKVIFFFIYFFLLINYYSNPIKLLNKQEIIRPKFASCYSPLLFS